MPATKRATIYFDPALHDALRERAAEEEMSISDIVNVAVRQTLADYEQDAEDLAELDRRRDEPNIAFDDVVADLKRRGRL
jgi:Ribbon-helix-helix protein, copG family.